MRRPNYPPVKKKELISFLKGNVDVFAWSSYKALGIDLDFICHHLNVSLGAVPRRQTPRRSSKEHAEAVKEGVNRLRKRG